MNIEGRAGKPGLFSRGRSRKRSASCCGRSASCPTSWPICNIVSLTILNALKRLPELYLQDFHVRSIVPLLAAEEKWLWDGWGPGPPRAESGAGPARRRGRIHQPDVERLAAVHGAEPVRRRRHPSGPGLPNSCWPTSCCRSCSVTIRELEMEVGQDFREIFIQEVLDHLQAIGRPGRTSASSSPNTPTRDPTSRKCWPSTIADRHGLTIVHADPAELYIEGGEVYYDGMPDRHRLSRLRSPRPGPSWRTTEGVNLDPMRLLFRQNRIISSMAGEFDHKSCWEMLTDTQFTQKYFTAEERQVFRRHILWTRLLSERETTLPDGETGDLLQFVRGHHDLLVLKPNRSYGGDRVVIGPAVDAAEWDARSTVRWPIRRPGSCSGWPVCRSTSFRWSTSKATCTSSRFTR